MKKYKLHTIYVGNEAVKISEDLYRHWTHDIEREKKNANVSQTKR